MSASPQLSKSTSVTESLFGNYRHWTSIDREAVIQAHIGLVQYLADRMASNLPSWVDTDDLVGAGLLGLLEAVDKFDPSRCVLFKTYAEKRVRGAMLDSLRSMDWVPRSVRRRARETKATVERLHQELNREPSDDEVAAALGLTPVEFRQITNDLNRVNLISFDSIESDTEAKAALQLPADPGESPIALYEAKQRRDRVRKAIAALPDRERQVVLFYYVFELSMAEIASELGVTVSRVSQIHSQAVKRLRAGLNPNQTKASSRENIFRFSKSSSSRAVSTGDRLPAKRSLSYNSQLPGAPASTSHGHDTDAVEIAAA